MRTIFYYHIPSTQLAHNIAYLILYLDILQFLLCRFDSLLKIRVEIPYNLFPLYLSFSNTIQQSFHVCSKINIHNSWKGFLHYIINCLTKFSDIQVLILLGNIMSRNNCCDSRCIGTWSSYSQFLKLFN